MLRASLRLFLFGVSMLLVVMGFYTAFYALKTVWGLELWEFWKIGSMFLLLGLYVSFTVVVKEEYL